MIHVNQSLETNNLMLEYNEFTLETLKENHTRPLALVAQDAQIWNYLQFDYHQPEVFIKVWFSKAMAHKEIKELRC